MWTCVVFECSTRFSFLASCFCLNAHVNWNAQFSHHLEVRNSILKFFSIFIFSRKNLTCSFHFSWLQATSPPIADICWLWVLSVGVAQTIEWATYIDTICSLSRSKSSKFTFWQQLKSMTESTANTNDYFIVTHVIWLCTYGYAVCVCVCVRGWPSYSILNS